MELLERAVHFAATRSALVRRGPTSRAWMPTASAYCSDANQVPLAEVKPEEEVGAVHDQVPEADAVAAPVVSTEKVPANEHDAPAPPIPSIVKLPLVELPLLLFSVPLPAPGAVAVITDPATPRLSAPLIGQELPPVKNCVPVKVPE